MLVFSALPAGTRLGLPRGQITSSACGSKAAPPASFATRRPSVRSCSRRVAEAS